MAELREAVSWRQISAGVPLKKISCNKFETFIGQVTATNSFLKCAAKYWYRHPEDGGHDGGAG
jgi:hypothetical protein